MKKYEMVIFDVDGTLLDTTEGVLNAVRYAIETAGLPKLSEDVLRTFIGPPIQDSFGEAYHIEDKQYLQELAGIFRGRYKDCELLKAYPYEGIYEVFDGLSAAGIKPAIATYKREDYARIIMQHFGFDRYTDIIFGADHENKLKKKDIICKCLEAYNQLPAEAAIMVGDTEHDALAARMLGMDFLGVTYGFGFKTQEELAEYSEISAAGSAGEILTILGGKWEEK